MIDEAQTSEGIETSTTEGVGWRRLSGYGEVILSNLLWGTIWIIVKLLPLPASVILFYRVVFAASILAILFTASHQWRSIAPRQNKLWLLGVVIALPFAWITGLFAVQLNPVILAVLLYNTSPVFTVLFAGLILRERTESTVAIALPVSLIGVLMLVLPNQQDFNMQTTIIGAVFAIVAAMGQGLQVVFMKKTGRHYPALGIVFYSCMLAMVFLAPLALSASATVTPRDFFLIFILGAMNTVLAYSVYIHGLRTVKAQHAAILGYIEPAFAAILAIIIFGEQLSVFTLVGGALIFGAGYYVVYRQKTAVIE